MKSSFKRAYEKRTHADGSIELEFKTERIGAHAGTAFTILVMLLLPVSCGVTFPVVSIFGDVTGKSTSILVLWNGLAVALWVGVLRAFVFSRRTLIIRPGDGVIFDGKQLPFRDIQSIGTVHETTARNPRGNAYVSAQSHGVEVRLTRYMKKELADAITTEIKEGSATAWA
jgi:hypothetical protein